MYLVWDIQDWLVGPEVMELAGNSSYFNYSWPDECLDYERVRGIRREHE